MESKKINIRNLTLVDLKKYFISIGEKEFRAKQVYEWIWKKSARSFDIISNLSINTREKLKNDFCFDAVSILSKQESKDGTIKLAFKLFDDNIIEGVLIPTDSRTTACISSQVGCSLGCKFCATAKIGYSRNLEFYEIFDQISILNQLSVERYNIPLSNIVYMGMGEPLLNYENVKKSIDIITSADSFNFSPRRITVSTVGLHKIIKQMGDDNAKYNLALSLHVASEYKRNEIIPANKGNSLALLIDSLKYYYKKTNNRITIEYLLLDKYNDSTEDAANLAKFCKNFPVKINIIEYNNTLDSEFVKSTNENLNNFVNYLESKNIVVNIRKSRGNDIDAACGQLANKNKSCL